ncbi:hypothetical protein AB0E83_15760 [Streptomyces sp. NPDC035033]|uniref:hypothetical protein n=1 Tax=Streptomyces sp. NPDC035033 TaxID=3155368 RepID=UPI0033FB8A13
MISTAGELLAALAPLSHSARLRLTAVTAHRLARQGELKPLLAELDALGPYERRLAALAALAAEDGEHLAARLGDLDPVVRRYALRGARRLALPDAAVEAAYDDAPAVVRADLARLLRDGRRRGLAERLVPRVRAEYGDRDAARLLAGCSPEFAARWLPELVGALAPEEWNAPALRHPLAVLDHAERELGSVRGRLRDAWWRQYAAALAAALPAAPERVLALLEEYRPDTLPGPLHDRLGELVAVDAERVARWFTGSDRGSARRERTPGPAVMRRLVAADPPSLAALGARWFHRSAFDLLLRTVPPARRAGFVDAVVAAGAPRGNVRVREGDLASLPPAERHARARAALDALAAEGRPDRETWWLRALLPPAEARPPLLAALGTDDAEDRGTLWEVLVDNAGRGGDPDEVAAVLALAAGRLAGERDSVRREFLSAVAGLPAPLLVAALGAGPAGGSGAASLERLCRNALAARDRSPLTRDAVRDLAVALLSTDAAAPPADPAGQAEHAGPAGPSPLAVRLLEALAAHTGTVALGRLDGLPRTRTGGVRALVGALGPWLDRSAARGDVTSLLALAGSLGRRAYGVPELQDRLAKALAVCPDGVYGEVAAAWLADPATRGDRVAELLAREPSAVFLPQVLAVLAAERTDLLDRALVEDPPAGGRFPVAGTPRPLPAFRYADRWLPGQQEAAVRLAAAVVADPGRGIDERAAVLRAVAPVPEHGRALLRRYAAPVRDDAAGHDGAAGSAAGAAGSVLAAAALDAAARADEPAPALGALLDHVGDDRAAAAWSAAGRAAAHARPSEVTALLHDVLTRESGVKVTVRKAAARLAVRHLPPAAAVALLAAACEAPGAHPDVRATVVGLAPALLPAPEMWALLEAAVADGPEPARRALLDASPADLPPAHRPRYGELLARLPSVAGEETANTALYRLADWARYAPAAGAALADVYTDLATPLNLWRASGGLNELARSGLPHPLGGVAPGSLLRGVVDRLLALVAAGEPEGGGREGDLPALRRLHSLLVAGHGDRRLDGDLARLLADEPAAAATRTALLVRAVDLRAAEPGILRAAGELVAAIEGRPVLAARVAEELEEAHQYGDPIGDPAAVLGAVRALAAGGGLVEGLLAVALANAVGIRQNWPDACRAAVVALRRHPDREVRELAYETDLGRHR